MTQPPRRVALVLTLVALVLAVGGALSFRRFVSHSQRDPGFPYRDQATLEKVMQRPSANL